MVAESAIHDTSDWPKERLVEQLPQFLDKYSASAGRSKSLSVASKKAGAPHTLVITSAGLRAADITRYGCLVLFSCLVHSLSLF